MIGIVRFILVWGGFGIAFVISNEMLGIGDRWLFTKMIISIAGGIGGFAIADKVVGVD